MKYLLMFALAGYVSADTADTALGNAKSFREIERVLQQQTVQANAELDKLAKEHNGDIPAPDLVRLLTKQGDIKIAAGDRMLQMTSQSWEKEEGFRTMVQGYEILDQVEKLQYFEKKRTEKKPPELNKLATEASAIETVAGKKIAELMSEIEKEGKYDNLIGNYWRAKYQKKYYNEVTFDDKSFSDFIAETKMLLNKNLKSLPPEHVISMANNIARSMRERNTQPQTLWKNLFGNSWQAETEKELSAFIRSDACTLPKESKETALSALSARHRRDIGAELKLYGIQLDGKELDWNALLKKNKVVLVKFTATWCGPCKGEIPFMKKAYDKYHNKGFEIVSVYCHEHGDDKLKLLEKTVADEKLPWHIVSEDLTVKAGKEPQSTHYTIERVPTMLLVDADGKVLDTEVRGTKLGEKLENIFK